MAEPVNITLKRTTRIAVAVVVLAFAVLTMQWMVSTAPKAEVNPDAAPARSVIVLETSPTDVRRRFNGYGVADAVYHADVPTRVTSTVVGLPETTRAGAPVVEGQMLVQLDDHDFKVEEVIAAQAIVDIESQLASLAVEQESAAQRRNIAQEEVDLTSKDFERIKTMQSRDAAHQREVDQINQQLLAKRTALVTAEQNVSQLRVRQTQLIATQRSQEANRRLAQQRVKRCRIVSPHAGYIEAIDVREGESLTAGMRVARVVDPMVIEVPLRLPSSSRSLLEVGGVVELHATGASNARWMGRLLRLSPEDDSETRTLAAYVEYRQDSSAESKSSYLAPGQFVRGEIIGTESSGKWIVPRRAVRDDRLLLVVDDAISSRSVEVDYPISGEFKEFGLPDRDWLVLKTPLSVGDQIVLNPTRALIDGLPVAPISARDAMAAVERTLDDEGRTQ